MITSKCCLPNYNLKGNPECNVKPKQLFVKTCYQICIEADLNKDNLQALSDLWKYVVDNKYHFPLTQIHFIKEHLENYAREMARNDIQFLKNLIR